MSMRRWLCCGLLILLVMHGLAPWASAQRRGGGGGGRGRITEETAASLTLGTVPAFDQLAGDPPLDVSLAWGTSVPTVPAKVVRYAEIVLECYDRDGDGVLQRSEWEHLPSAPQAMDVDGDLEVTLEELVRKFVAYGQGRTIHRPLRPEPIHRAAIPASPATRRLFHPVSTSAATSIAATSTSSQAATANDAASNIANTASDLESDMTDAVVTAAAELSPEEIIAAEQQIPAERRYHTHTEELAGVPAWFLLRDKNGDGQISIVEFAPQLSAAALALFGQLDQNGNGLISPQETKPR